MGLSEDEKSAKRYNTVLVDESRWTALSSRSPSLPVHREVDKNNNEYSKLYNEHVIIKSIGKGAYGRVVKAMTKASGEICAIKIIEIGEETSETEAENEASIHRQLIHDNIVLYYDSWMSDNSFYIRMEYCQNGTLKRAIEAGICSQRCWMLAEQLLKAINHLHHQGVAHCDLKSNNILIDDGGLLKLIDFGNADRLEPTVYCRELQTFVYSGYPADLVKSDIKDIGEILFEMCYGPFADEKDLAESKDLFLRESVSSSSDDIEDGFPLQQDVIRLLLNKDLDKLPRPKESEAKLDSKESEPELDSKETEPKLDSEDQFLPSGCPSFGSLIEWLPKLIAQNSCLLLGILLLICLLVLSCVILILHTAQSCAAKIHRTMENTIQYKATYREVFKLTMRVTWQFWMPRI